MYLLILIDYEVLQSAFNVQWCISSCCCWRVSSPQRVLANTGTYRRSAPETRKRCPPFNQTQRVQVCGAIVLVSQTNINKGMTVK